jgi:hypothetical protein
MVNPSKLGFMTDFNAKKSREPWVRENMREFFTSLLGVDELQ